MYRIYWANSIFSKADRDFNTNCVTLLRQAGYSVINPQENPFNEPGQDETADNIFENDTTQIKECDILVACIDQETIDSGVACEIGIAWALGKRIIGLCTDMRQYRKGRHCMYKNPYVIGCIESRGKVVAVMDELLEELELV